MSDFARFGFGLVVAGLLTCSVGCYDEAPPAVPPSSPTDPTAMPPADMPPPQQPEGEPATLPTEGDPQAEPGVEGEAAPPAGDQTEAAKIEASLASLSTEDRALAEKQKICPVGGGPLGAMGTPIKVLVAGHEVFICCEHCEEPLVTDPVKHLAKIGLEPKEEEAVQ